MKFFKFTNQFHGTSGTLGLSDPIDAGQSEDGRQITIVMATQEVLAAAGKFICTNWRNPADCMCKQELSPKPFFSEAGDSYFFLNALEAVEGVEVQI